MYCKNKKFYHKSGNPLRLRFSLTDEDGEILDVTDAPEVKFQIRLAGVLVIEKTKSDMTIDTALDVLVEFTSDELTLDDGLYTCGVEITDTDGNTTEPEPNIIFVDEDGNEIEFSGFYIISGTVEAGT